MSGPRRNVFAGNPLIPGKQDKPTWQKLRPCVTRVASLQGDASRCVLPVSSGKILLWSAERLLENDKSTIDWGLGWQSLEALGIPLLTSDSSDQPTTTGSNVTDASDPATCPGNLTSAHLVYLGELGSKPYFAVEIPSDPSSKLPEIGRFSAPGPSLQHQWVNNASPATGQNPSTTGQFDPADRQIGQAGSIGADRGSDAVQLAFVDMMTLMQAADPENPGHMADVAIAGQARAMTEWHKQARFCGTCGTQTAPSEAGTRRACTATKCGAKSYPRLDPVVIMLVLDESRERAVLGRQPKFPPHMWSCLAGFMEPGESMEEAVCREVREEVGLEVSTVVHHSSQPWPVGFGNMLCQLMVGFEAQVSNHDICIDGKELEDARWFTRDEVRKGLDFARYERDRKAACARIHSSQNKSNSHSGRQDSRRGEERKDQPLDGFYLPGPYAIAHCLIRDWVFESVG